MKQIELFDTTPRDGSQDTRLKLSPDQIAEYAAMIHKHIPKMIVEVSYAHKHLNNKESPKEVYDKLRDKHPGLDDVISTFGFTHKPGVDVTEDSNVKAMLDSNAKIATVFGKTWAPEVDTLGVSTDTYLQMIEDTVAHLLDNGVKRVVYDGEHTFSGLEENFDFALDSFNAAIKGGADTLVLCDTKGKLSGKQLKNHLNSLEGFFKDNPEVRIGFHGHNDRGLAVSNTIDFVEKMQEIDENIPLQIQGTVNGYGERTGNADILTIAANLIEDGYNVGVKPEKMTYIANTAARIFHVDLEQNKPFVGGAAFAHKGGMHISSEAKRPGSYQHVDPEKYGNSKKLILSDQSGRTFYLTNLAEKYGYDNLERTGKAMDNLMEKIDTMENDGYDLSEESAEHLLLVHSVLGDTPYKINIDKWNTQSSCNTQSGERESQTTYRGNVKYGHNTTELIEVAMGESGPVDTQFEALRKGLSKPFPYVDNMKLVDFKINIAKRDGSKSAVKTDIYFKNGTHEWHTQGVSENKLEASFEALQKGFEYYILLHEVNQYKKI